ncbi:MAG: hypothetical protein ACE15D_10680 [Candidatus Eisenbacteria bacterium]
MPRHTFTAPRSIALLVLIPLAGALSGLVDPQAAQANLGPAALIYFDVRPFEGPYPCEPPSMDCEDMQQTTPAEGYVEFKIYVQSNSGTPVTSFTADMTWPDEWWLYDFSFCQGGTGTLDYWGGNPHRLEVHFPCEGQPYPFLAVHMIMSVHGYGKLTTDNAHLWAHCPPEGHDVIADSMYGEAGPGCEFTNQPCDFWEFACEPNFSQDHLDLSAVAGGDAHGEISFSAGYWWMYEWYPCSHDWDTQTGETWCTADCVEGGDAFETILRVDADAAELEPGVYETWVQVERWQHTLARCIDVTLTVSEPTAVSKVSWGAVRAMFR